MMKSAYLAIGLAWVLAACSNLGGRPGATYDQIQSEMKGAIASAGKKDSVDAVSQALLPPIQVDMPAPSKHESRFDLSVSNAPAPQVFMALVSGTRYSMLVPPEVEGSISISLKNVTLKEALDSLRDLYGYDYRVKGTRITVMPNTLQTRVFKVNYLSGRRRGTSDVRVTSSSISVVAPGSTTGNGTSSGSNTGTQTTNDPNSPAGTRAQDAARVFTTQDADFWPDLKTSLEAIVGTENGRSVVLNALSGVIVVKAFPTEMREVEKYLKATQLVIERQVMLEAKILDVQLSDSYQAGVNWSSFKMGHSPNVAIGVAGNNAALGPAGSTIGATTANGTVAVAQGALATTGSATSLGGGFSGLALQTRNFAALLNFLDTQGTVHVLSSPRIASINNQKAVLKVGKDDYYVTNVSSTTTASGSGTVTTPSITLQPFFSGISLDVTPQIDDDSMITLHIHPSIAVVTQDNRTINLGAMGNYQLPLASSDVSETDSIVRVRDGNIVAIGGLMRQEQDDTRSGLPGMSTVPVVGNLFGQRSKLMSKRELVILIKPTVIQDDEDWKGDLEATESRLEDLNPPRSQP